MVLFFSGSQSKSKLNWDWTFSITEPSGCIPTPYSWLSGLPQLRPLFYNSIWKTPLRHQNYLHFSTLHLFPPHRPLMCQAVWLDYLLFLCEDWKLVSEPKRPLKLSRNKEISPSPGCSEFEHVYCQMDWLIRKNIRSSHSKMVLKFHAVSTLPHHLLTYSEGTQHKGQLFTTLLLLAASSKKHNQHSQKTSNLSKYCNYFNCTHAKWYRSLLLLEIIIRLFITTVTLVYSQQVKCGNLGMTWLCSNSPTSHLLNLVRNMSFLFILFSCKSFTYHSFTRLCNRFDIYEKTSLAHLCSQGMIETCKIFDFRFPANSNNL